MSIVLTSIASCIEDDKNATRGGKQQQRKFRKERVVETHLALSLPSDGLTHGDIRGWNTSESITYIESQDRSKCQHDTNSIDNLLGKLGLVLVLLLGKLQWHALFTSGRAICSECI